MFLGYRDTIDRVPGSEVTIIHDCTLLSDEAIESDGREGDMWEVGAFSTCTKLSDDILKNDSGDGVDVIGYLNLECDGNVGWMNIIHIGMRH